MVIYYNDLVSEREWGGTIGKVSVIYYNVLVSEREWGGTIGKVSVILNVLVTVSEREFAC